MNLSKHNLSQINTAVIKPADGIFSLPEKVLQFGTGVLLRGLPDYYINGANMQGVFNGRVVVVKSTGGGEKDHFDEQDNLYTIHTRGINSNTEKPVICAAISRVLHAKTQWNNVLQTAHQPALQVIISNTTEVGIQLVKEKINAVPPESFPAKLLAFLYERYTAFDGSTESGMIILPTELLTDNGKKLAAIVNELAEWNNLDQPFINWLNTANRFCNTLVDRIVPGKPGETEKIKLETELGYTDDLAIVVETYNLWAIEGDEYVKSILTFAKVNKGIIIEPNIEKYKELKLRLLNATHTLSCGAAVLAGFDTVKNAMGDEHFFSFVKSLMLDEIANAIPVPINEEEVKIYGLAVLDRFKNPHIQHHWINITQQYSTKMKMRVIPLLQKHYRLFNHAPKKIAFGFAAYIVFMKPVRKNGTEYFGVCNGNEYRINDDKADMFYVAWQMQDTAPTIKNILQNETLWGINLIELPGFEQEVLKNINEILSGNVFSFIQNRV